MQTRRGDGHNVEVERFLQDIKTVLREGQDLLRERVNSAREQAAAGVRTTDRYLREHPYQTLGVALGAGVLVGLLASSLLKRRPESEAD